MYYQTPIADMLFVLYELHTAQKIEEIDVFKEFNRTLVTDFIKTTAQFSEKVLFPLNILGDQQGCKLQEKQVTTPEGFKAAYQQFSQGGWSAMSCKTEHGGLNMPKRFHSMIEEIFCSANLSFSMYPGLSFGAYHTLDTYASSDIKNKYLSKLAEGTYAGTMCLTEPHCGTDLGLCKTKAVPCDDGAFTISGNKIFISAGDHDLSENIIHLVLARTPGAAPGIRGISLFVVPKFEIDDAGNTLSNSKVECIALENKMGINGSATCSLVFDQAQGWLVGELGEGIKCMFSMMNRARLAVGLQGLGLCEIAYQGAVSYAKTRLQGHSLSKQNQPQTEPVSIITHPDVRRMLLTMRAYTQGCRAFGSWVAMEYDSSKHAINEQDRIDADEFVQLTTPILKAFFTDCAFECTNLGVQVFGGHGYIKESGMEQYVRDSRITQIYEGTNGIQALDLIGRKLADKGGRNLRHFFHPIDRFLQQHEKETSLAPFLLPLKKSFERLQKASINIAMIGLSNPEYAAAVASEYLRLFGLVALAFMWCKMAKISQLALLEPESELANTHQFYQAKIATASFYMQKILPQNSALFAIIMSSGQSVMQLSEDQF
jgi:alkylation response protein AidB-like acyl-CoA dehydrogenase